MGVSQVPHCSVVVTCSLLICVFFLTSHCVNSCSEFVSCVQSIKILSSAEVQQMSLDGDLGNLPVPNQACSGSDSGNAWRHYDDNSAASFNR